MGATSIEFLSVEGLYKALLKEKRNDNYPQFSDHCYFTGEYPIKALDKLGDEKNYSTIFIKQQIKFLKFYIFFFYLQ